MGRLADSGQNHTTRIHEGGPQTDIKGRVTIQESDTSNVMAKAFMPFGPDDLTLYSDDDPASSTLQDASRHVIHALPKAPCKRNPSTDNFRPHLFAHAYNCAHSFDRHSCRYSFIQRFLDTGKRFQITTVSATLTRKRGCEPQRETADRMEVVFQEGLIRDDEGSTDHRPLSLTLYILMHRYFFLSMFHHAASPCAVINLTRRYPTRIPMA